MMPCEIISDLGCRSVIHHIFCLVAASKHFWQVLKLLCLHFISTVHNLLWLKFLGVGAIRSNRRHIIVVFDLN